MSTSIAIQYQCFIQPLDNQTVLIYKEGPCCHADAPPGFFGSKECGALMIFIPLVTSWAHGKDFPLIYA